MSHRRKSSKGRRQSVWYSLFGRNPYVPCCYCGCWLTFHAGTTEHLLDRGKGGEDIVDNCNIACETCNITKDKVTTFLYSEIH